MKTILYFHGLGSSAASRKFVRLQQVFSHKYQLICSEWTYTTSIRILLGNLLTQYENEKSIVIIGSSTGGNFAYQLAERLRFSGVKVKLILINPLLHIAQRTSQRPFPIMLEGYLREIKEVRDCTLILSRHDEMIDHSDIKLKEAVNVFEIDDNHQVKDLKRLLAILKEILNKKKQKTIPNRHILVSIEMKIELS